MKITYAGSYPSPSGLVVCATVEEAAWMRFVQVKVPWIDLMDGQLLHELDQQMRHRLSAEHSAYEPADPLF